MKGESLTIKSVHYEAVVGIAVAKQGTSLEKIFQELGVEPLKLEDGSDGFVVFLK